MRISDLTGLIRSISREAASVLAKSTLPQTCAGCGLTGAWFCPDCRRLLIEDGPAGCRRCGRSGHHGHDCGRCRSLFPVRLRRLRAGYAYDGPMRRAVQRFKYAREYERGRDLGRMLASRFDSLYPKMRLDAIVPVPLHPRRYRERGFNQSTILAEALRDVAGAPVVPAVRRSRHTTPQAGLSSNDRLRNLAGAFAPEEDHLDTVAGKRVLIVDDVTTTGATIAAVAVALQHAGVAEISALTLAREQ